MRRTLEKHQRAGHLEGSLVLSPFQGIGRYTVADQITMFLIADEMGGDLKDFPQKYMEAIGEAIDLAGALGDVVDYLITHVLAPHVGEIEQQNDVVKIHPLLVRAKEEVDKMRRQEGQ